MTSNVTRFKETLHYEYVQGLFKSQIKRMQIDIRYVNHFSFDIFPTFAYILSGQAALTGLS